MQKDILMKIIDNNRPTFLLSRNTTDIRIECPDATYVDFSIIQGITPRYSTRLTPLDGGIDIPVRELLRSLKCRIPFQSLSGIKGERVDLPNLALVFSDPASGESLSWQKNILDGGVDGNQESVTYFQWLTWRPRESHTFRKAHERLYCLIPVTYGDETVVSLDVYIDIYTAVAGKHTVRYMSFTPIDRPSLAAVNVSYSEIITHDEIAGLQDYHIVAYDVYANLTIEYADATTKTFHEQIKKQRFILRLEPHSATCFIFLNSLGVYDTISSFGEVTRKLDADLSTVVTDMNEKVVANDCTKEIEVNTGYICSERMLAQWEDFFSSEESYIMLPDGQPVSIVLDNPSSEFVLGHLDALTFSYRLAEPPAGRFYANTDLDYFDYDTAEL